MRRRVGMVRVRLVGWAWDATATVATATVPARAVRVARLARCRRSAATRAVSGCLAGCAAPGTDAKRPRSSRTYRRRVAMNGQSCCFGLLARVSASPTDTGAGTDVRNGDPSPRWRDVSARRRR
uniref:Uncharacterized protein n=1 Tax=Mycobacterium sp. (strain JLS) TaxID=164757 RepID=A0A5Q5CJ13_MYCSJ